jgi:hypothetical protein
MVLSRTLLATTSLLLVHSPSAAGWSSSSSQLGTSLVAGARPRASNTIFAIATKENWGVPEATGIGIGKVAEDVLDRFARLLVDKSSDGDTDKRRVDAALDRMQRDMSMLDEAAGRIPQLSPVETLLLSSTVIVAFVSPYALPAKVVELLVPAMSSLSAAIGFSAEYLGKVAVSQGKEVAAATVMCAAEAESLLAQAERAKAIIPLMVGTSATAGAFALLVPVLLGELATKGLGLVISTEIYLICPLIAVLSASVAALAARETQSLASAAINVGARRFSSSEDVGRTWLSATEQIENSVTRSQKRWRDFAVGVLPAPLMGILIPGTFSRGAIVVAAIAAAQTAFSLAQAEFSLSAAVESVAIKSRTAAVSDTYANQGARAGAILPFTSALSGLCAATTVAVVEVLPFVGSTFAESLVCVAFPAIGSVIAAAASISKARCEVDAAAATAAATQLSSRDVDMSSFNPGRNTLQLVQLTVRSLRKEFREIMRTPGTAMSRFVAALRWLLERAGVPVKRWDADARGGPAPA